MDSNNEFIYPEYNLIKKVIILSLLPYDKIEEGVKLIQMDIDKAFSGNVNWIRFLTYYKEKWLNKIMPERFSVHDDVERTNDYWTDYVSTINGRIGNNANTNKLISKCIN